MGSKKDGDEPYCRDLRNAFNSSSTYIPNCK